MGDEVKVLLLLVPSLLFFLISGEMRGLHDEDLVAMQHRANLITAEMNRLSANISDLLQGVTLGQRDQAEVQPAIDRADLLMQEKREKLEGIWSRIDTIKIRGAHDEAVGRILRSFGLLSGFVAFAAISTRGRELVGPSIVGLALLLGLGAV